MNSHPEAIPPVQPVQPVQPAQPAAPTAWLALGLLKRDLRDRYAGTAGGLLWALVQPLLMLALYSFVFAWVLRIRLPGMEGQLAFVIFVALAMWPWFMFQDSLLRAMGAMRAQATLIRKTALPRDLPVLVSCLATLLVHGAGYLLVLLALAFAGADFHLRGVPLLLLTLIGLSAMIVALGWIASAAQMVWRDLEQAMQPILLILFYATPILYAPTMVPEEMRAFITANPLAWLFSRLRDAMLQGALPGIADMLFCVGALLLVWLTRRVYLRIARQAEDLL